MQDKGEYDPSKEKTFVPSPVNRIDRNTTGLVIFGKTAAALRLLTGLLRERDHVEKYYMTIVCGKLDKEMDLDGRLAKDHDRNISSVDDEGKEARTYVRPLITGEKFSLAEARIFTGRTHQIRVHLASAGYPLAGDVKYGTPKMSEYLKKQGVTMQLLHAYKLVFKDMPEELASLEGKVVEAAPPADFAKAQEKLVR